MRTLVLFACLLVSIIANTRVEVTCAPCSSGNGDCLTYNGGPFNNDILPSPSACGTAYPTTLEFNCTTKCPGCQIFQTKGGQTTSACSGSLSGNVITRTLNIAYSMKVGDVTGTSTYDWCACSANAGASAGGSSQSGANPNSAGATSGGAAPVIANTNGVSTLSHSNTRVQINCAQKGNNFFETYNGGPFNNNQFRTYRTQCGNKYPITLDFTCGSQCSTQCQVTLSMHGVNSHTNYCNDSYMGTLATHFLDGKLRLQEGNNQLNNKYDWCKCNQNNLGVLNSGVNAGTAAGTNAGASGSTNAGTSGTSGSTNAGTNAGTSGSTNAGTSGASGSTNYGNNAAISDSPIILFPSAISSVPGNLRNNDAPQSSGVQIPNTGAQVTVTCGQCGDQICQTYNGGPFNNNVYLTSRQTCGSRYPITFNFSCNPSCPSKCQVATTSSAISSQTACAGFTNSLIGEATLTFLNRRYSTKLGDSTLSSSYGWCNCA